MKSEEAIKYAKMFAECDETDQSYIDNNDIIGMMVACGEEAAECSAAIGKWIRTQGIGPITPMSEEEAIENVKEELADVVSTGILLMHKMGWIEECIKRHKKKSVMCDGRIKEKQGASEQAPALSLKVEDYGIKYTSKGSYIYMIYTNKDCPVKVFIIIEGNKIKNLVKPAHIIKYDKGRADYIQKVDICKELESIEDFRFEMYDSVEPKLTSEMFKRINLLTIPDKMPPEDLREVVLLLA